MNQYDIEAIVEELNIHHKRQSILCTQLESLADSLPVDVDHQYCLTIARQIYPILKQAHDFEEQTLFPILSAFPQHNEQLNKSLERLRFEHWEDESFAEELTISLRQYCNANSTRDGEKLSYMLRGFFDGLRRHLAFEIEHLLPMLESGSIETSH